MPLTTQCKILNLSRSVIYYLPVPVSDKDRELMRLIDEIRRHQGLDNRTPDEVYWSTLPGVTDAMRSADGLTT